VVEGSIATRKGCCKSVDSVCPYVLTRHMCLRSASAAYPLPLEVRRWLPPTKGSMWEAFYGWSSRLSSLSPLRPKELKEAVYHYGIEKGFFYDKNSYLWYFNKLGLFGKQSYDPCYPLGEKEKLLEGLGIVKEKGIDPMEDWEIESGQRARNATVVQTAVCLSDSGIDHGGGDDHVR